MTVKTPRRPNSRPRYRVSRGTRRWVSLFAMVVLLFSQLAIAAYACPRVAAAPNLSAADASASLADAEQPALCHQHCQQGTQHPEQGKVPAPPAVALTSALTVDIVPLDQCGGAFTRRYALDRDRAQPPPLSILHCRIRS